MAVYVNDTSDAASHPALAPGLYIVATPIGNLNDITLRAVDVLKRCDAVACEDTRVTGKLMRHLGLSKPLWRYDDHTDARNRARLIESMGTRAVALVSDAGTPLISDPGYQLVNAAREAGIYIQTIPGPCAAIAAITLAGLPSDRFLFAGFLPVKEKARADMLAELGGIDATLLFYESAGRLTKALAAIGVALPGRRVGVARELTKIHEECRVDTPAALIAHYEAKPPKGEIVLLVEPPEEQEASEEDVDRMLREALATDKPSQAAAKVAKATGADRKALYSRALELRG
ncbi:16S rRNA (cytidine(1402)-2'-O)-methyltransferase [Citromicrobium bathyomarinum]|uniref:16S rRNA (cytidine(1402)-2'-O)-methyltransferase n=1 Tax=Citromicrobium bathyomarinum TaxID=72174 RepID=UPI00315A863F